MKKLFLLALTLLLVSNGLFAVAGDLLKTDSLNIVLNLLNSTANVNVGITTTTPSLDLINLDTKNYGESIAEDNRSLALSKDSLKSAITLYIWYYVNGMADQCSISFKPSPFKGYDAEGNEVADALLKYNLTKKSNPILDTNYKGTVPAGENHTVTESYSESDTIITSNLAGISKGFIEYLLDVDYTTAKPLKYIANIIVEVNAK